MAFIPNERQAVELAQLLFAPEELIAAWYELVEQYGDKVTAVRVRTHCIVNDRLDRHATIPVRNLSDVRIGTFGRLAGLPEEGSKGRAPRRRVSDL